MFNIKANLDRLAEVEAHPNIASGMNQLIDYRGCNSNITSAELIEQATIALPLVTRRNSNRVARLVDSNYLFGMRRMYEVHAEYEGLKEDLRTFRDVDEANSWLELPLDFTLSFD